MADYVAQLGLTEDQKNLMIKLKKDMKIPENNPFDGIRDDLTLYRFLNAKKWDYDLALKQYTAYLKYREDEKVDQIHQWAAENKQTVDLVNSLFPIVINGHDKEARPVVYERIGIIPAARFAKLVTVDDCRKVHTLFMEDLMAHCREETKKHKRPIFGVVVIVDLGGGLSMESRHFIPFFKNMGQQDEQNYPEIAHKVFCVNAPFIFPVLYKMVKYFIDPNTREKIEVFSDCPTERLLELIDGSILNHEWGGENLEEIPTIKRIDLGEIGNDMKEQNVAARDTFEYTVVCDHKKGGKFIWSMELDSLDIDFSVEWKGKKDKKSKVVAEVSRVDKHEGSFIPKTKGELKLIFDNTYSYITSKNVKYACLFHSYSLLKTQRLIEEKQEKERKKAEKESEKSKSKLNSTAESKQSQK
mmetsp:Transcript_5712/g.10501  ORF Transcript_5712/g.10501 Transcript_5712/m.10501 type:complete len:414 (+) Transcript_5712:90-1331(+)|eukprot:CAMPEP_0197520762 /NCGR_PEP_ID=MMETSP1318-20131121/6083_1 /TAXON_ID=552666 /ORGANISM="Partenskyella glossopodia, Strain RCC365" /LENGTH=413 /DNA_ID=CAMNT_0043072471 /DNA_START=50 /DNA_END=1291 /DNA_ORIENTATION=-